MLRQPSRLLALAFVAAVVAPLARAEDAAPKSPASCYTRQDLTARAAGFVEEVLVNDGQTVKKGDVLVELDHRLLSAAVKEAEAALQAAKAQHALAKDGLDRLRKMESSASEQELFAADVRVRQAHAQKAQAEAALERVRYQLEDTYIRAAIPGKVSGLPRVKGLFLQAGAALGRVEALPNDCAATK